MKSVSSLKNFSTEIHRSVCLRLMMILNWQLSGPLYKGPLIFLVTPEIIAPLFRIAQTIIQTFVPIRA